jgi:hypothetical protein
LAEEAEPPQVIFATIELVINGTWGNGRGRHAMAVGSLGPELHLSLSP